MSLLSPLSNGSHVACRPVSVTVEAVVVHLANSFQTPRIDVSHAAVREVNGLHPQGFLFVVVVQP